MSAIPSLPDEITGFLKEKPMTIEEMTKRSKITKDHGRFGRSLEMMKDKNQVYMRPSDARYVLVKNSYAIKDIELKIAVLKRLQPLLAQDISAVLKEIGDDLIRKMG